VLQGDQVLLVERGREPLRGYWSLPGGIVETGESLADAVCREMREETGLIIEPLQVVTIFERIMRDQADRVEYHYVLVDYLCEVRGGTMAAADDVAKVQWFPRSELGAIRLTEGSLGVIEKAFGLASAAVRPQGT
jgi:8-oxo-dGTP diphosphatase